MGNWNKDVDQRLQCCNNNKERYFWSSSLSSLFKISMKFWHSSRYFFLAPKFWLSPHKSTQERESAFIYPFPLLIYLVILKKYRFQKGQNYFLACISLPGFGQQLYIFVCLKIWTHVFVGLGLGVLGHHLSLWHYDIKHCSSVFPMSTKWFCWIY